MDCKLSELKSKEVINVENGMRLGYANDLMVDTETGRLTALVVPGKLRWLSREEDYVIPWDSISRMSDDLILVQSPQRLWSEKKNGSSSLFRGNILKK